LSRSGQAGIRPPQRRAQAQHRAQSVPVCYSQTKFSLQCVPRVKKIYTAANLLDAQLIRDSLLAAGIPVIVLNEFAQGGLGELPFTHTYPEIWLEDERDNARAAALIHQFEHRPTAIEQYFCRHCQEPNPASFETCWQCGKPLTDNTDYDSD
jgi:hypothetical protein